MLNKKNVLKMYLYLILALLLISVLSISFLKSGEWIIVIVGISLNIFFISTFILFIYLISKIFRRSTETPEEEGIIEESELRQK